MAMNKYKEDYCKVIKELIAFKLEYGERNEDIKNWLLNGGSITGIIEKVEFLNNPLETLLKKAEKMRQYDPNYKGIERVDDCMLEITKVELFVLVDLLNEYTGTEYFGILNIDGILKLRKL